MKLLAKIHLPYKLIFNSKSLSRYELRADDYFSYFKIDFIFDEEKSTVDALEIETIAKFIDESNFLKIDNAIFGHYYELERDTYEHYFLNVRNKLNGFLSALGHLTGMYWIQPLPLNHLSGCIGVNTEYVFIPSNAKVPPNARFFFIQDDSIIENYTDDIKPVTADILDKAKGIGSLYDSLTYIIYEDKARFALNTHQFPEMIMFLAISIETLFKMCVQEFFNFKSHDVVLKKFIDSGKNNFQETYTKLIYYYLFNTTLSEKNPIAAKCISDVFKLRNSLMHTGMLTKDDFKNIGHPSVSELNYSLSKEFFDGIIETNEFLFEEFTNLFHKLSAELEMQNVTE
ncbi:hypothetical protein MHB40_20390 [Lysinibacillus sp. FSL K6-0057]|uniref:hypothetical protein n=1 Tax=Lysinibacillus sp. FSL K6-0057 TaxID=2921411 RepID=UPI003159E2A0